MTSSYLGSTESLIAKVAVTTSIRPLPTNPAHTAPDFGLMINTQHPKDRKRFNFPYGPSQVVIDGIAHNWQTVDRPGRLPLLLRSAKNLRTLSFSFTVAHLNNQQDIDYLLGALTTIAQSSDYIRIYLGTIAPGYWRCTSLTQNVNLLTKYNHASQAGIDIEFTRASDAPLYSGPAKGGTKKQPQKSGPTTKKVAASKPKRVVRHYVCKKGDSLWEIALRFYGAGNYDHYIADYNHLKSMKLKVGQRLTLP